MNTFLRKFTGLFALTLLLTALTGCWKDKEREEEQVPPTPQTEQEEEEEPLSDVDEEQIADTAFVDNLLEKLPESYLVSEGEYFKSLGAEPQKATLVKPCDNNNDPTCFTILTIVETEEDTASLEEYIQNSDLNSYEERSGEKLVKGMYEDEIPYVYTPAFFMCLGTGAETCLRKHFVYHLEEGRNILVEMSYLPYENEEQLTEPNAEMQTVIDVYQKILIQ